jgi:hypothetical protein
MTRASFGLLIALRRSSKNRASAKRLTRWHLLHTVGLGGGRGGPVKAAIRPALYGRYGTCGADVRLSLARDDLKLDRRVPPSRISGTLPKRRAPRGLRSPSPSEQGAALEHREVDFAPAPNLCPAKPLIDRCRASCGYLLA